VANSKTLPAVPGLVSVIIPCFNQGGYLRDALDSVLTQTYHCLEIILVDDGSTDNTAEIAKSYGDRVRYFWLNDRGPSAARNLGLQHARGQYIQFLDGDDLLLPEALKLLIAGFDNSAELQAGYCDFMHGQAENPQLPTPQERILDWRVDLRHPLLDLVRRWETQLSLPPHCFLYDARIFREHGVRFDDVLLPMGMEDWDILLQVFALPVRLHRVDQCLVIYRSAETSATTRQNSSSAALEDRLQKVYAVIDKHSYLHRHTLELQAVLQQKRREMAARYARRIELSRWSLRKATKRFLRHQAASLPNRVKSHLKTVWRTK